MSGKCSIFRLVIVMSLCLSTSGIQMAAGQHPGGDDCFVEVPGISLTGLLNSSGAWGDYNNDGFLDFMVAGWGVTSLYRNNGNNTFTEQAAVPFPDLHYGYIAWADYDNDEDLDLLLTGSTITHASGAVTKIFRNNNSSFQEVTGHGITSIFKGESAWSDLDLDGDLDLVLSGIDKDEDPVTLVYWSDKGTFLQDETTLRGGQEVAIEDYNNDHYPDILVSGLDINGAGHATLYKNNGDRTFSDQFKGNLIAGTSPVCAWGDYNNDGFSDFFLCSIMSDGEYRSGVYRNNGDGTFTRQEGISITAGNGSSADWGDYDNDGWIDIVVSGSTLGTVGRYTTVFRNNGDNTFSETTQDIPAIMSGETSWGDYNRDGKLDLLVTGREVTGVYRNVCPEANSKPGIPQNPVHTASGNSARLSWDPSSDDKTPSQTLSYNVRVGSAPGYEDIVSPVTVVNTGYNGTQGRGNAYLNREMILNDLEPGTYYWSVEAVDNGLSGSGHTVEKSFTIYPAFTVGTAVPLSWTSGSSLAWGDHDDDNDLDILMTVDGTSTIFSNEQGSLVELTGLPLHVLWDRPAVITWGDYDNDNDLDVFLSGSHSDQPVSKIYRNLGAGLFEEDTGISLLGVFESSMDWGDYDNDGDLDIVLSGGDDFDLVSARIYRNDGTGGFTPLPENTIEDVTGGSVAWGDADNDRDLDLLIMGIPDGDVYQSTPVTRLYRNDGEDRFAEQTQLDLVDVYSGYAAWSDYDIDGDLDILISGADSNFFSVLSIYRNEGENIFTEVETGVRKVRSGTVVMGDYNNDGYPDMAVSGMSGKNWISKVYRNDQEGGFIDIGISELNERSSSLRWGDFDLDADLDLLSVVGDGYAGDLTVYRNNTDFDNHPPSTPGNLKSMLSGFDLVLSWDRATDPECPEGSLYYNIRIGTTPGGVEIMSPMSDLSSGYRKIPAMGNVQTNTGWILKSLERGKTYYWSVQAIDHSFTAGQWAAEQSIIMPNISADFLADTVCVGSPTVFTDLSDSPLEQITSWEWDFGDGGGTSKDPDSEYVYGGSGEYNVTLTVSSASYTHSITKNVKVRPAVVAGFDATEVCQGESTVFLNTSDSEGMTVTSWRWQFGDESLDFTGQHPPPHSYLAGAYTVILNVGAGNGCESIYEQEVLVGRMPSDVLSTSGDLTFCEGESFVLTAEAFTNFEYEWRKDNVPILNKTENVLVADESGVYKAKITNLIGHCTATTQEYSVSEIPLPAAPEVSSRNYIMDDCPLEDPVILSVVNPEAGGTYQWKHNGMIMGGENDNVLQGFLDEGNYSVVVDKNGCTAESDFFTIRYGDMPEKPDLFVAGPNVWYFACSNDSAQSYRWYLNDKRIDGAETYLYVAEDEFGKYQVSISNTGNCYATSDPVWIPLGTGIEIQPWENLKIYPNPTPGVFNLEMDNQIFGELLIDIFNEKGSKILQIKFLKETSHFGVPVDLSAQPPGIYMIGMRLNDFRTERKLVVE